MKDVYNKKFNEVFSEYFIALRKEKNYTRKEVAYFIHLNENTFLCYETGTRDVPISVFKRMCKFYNIDFYKTFIYLDQETTKRENEQV